jgi:hypothetical protein
VDGLQFAPLVLRDSAALAMSVLCVRVRVSWYAGWRSSDVMSLAVGTEITSYAPFTMAMARPSQPLLPTVW